MHVDEDQALEALIEVVKLLVKTTSIGSAELP